VIAVDRSIVSPPDSWKARAKEAADKARDEGSAHEAIPEVYGRDDVRATLEAVFSHKCAYCESPATAQGPWDVEHFRPKGRVAESPLHPGYYWLTYSWENLYLACQFCNQRRRDKPTTEDSLVRPAKGKLDQFPLRDEETRAMDPDADLALESRLLIDPCSDNPDDHLIVGVKGDIMALNDSDMGTRTIEVCNLARRRLTLARLAAVRTILDLIHRFAETAGLERAIGAVTDTLGKQESHYSLVARAIAAQPEAFGLV